MLIGVKKYFISIQLIFEITIGVIKHDNYLGCSTVPQKKAVRFNDLMIFDVI